MSDFVVVANRLPVDLDTATGQWSPSPGGLVAALSPVLASQRGCWVGWPGVADAAPEPFYTDQGVLLHPVQLSQRAYEEFYEGFSNATLWPLYHDLIVTPVYNRQWWQTFYQVNQRFSEEVARVASQDATVWVQDYQLHLVPGMLRNLRPDLKIGFFLHIPFPGPDLFAQLPWRTELVEGLLGADVLGFHLEANAANFLELARRQDRPVSGEIAVREANALVGERTRVGAFPISIDVHDFADPAPDTDQLRTELGNPRTVILGVDRLDYTKGILQRLTAFEELLESGELNPDEVVFVQLATPSRERIDHYQRTRSQVEEAVGRINGRFSRLGQPVVVYQHRSVPKSTLRRYYQLADIMLVTPFKDGMNLVAKEYVACRADYTGALVLSEFAGAAQELNQAYLCNPFDVDSIKNALLNAVHDGPEESQARMHQMHQQVATHGVQLWSQSFLQALEEK